MRGIRRVCSPSTRERTRRGNRLGVWGEGVHHRYLSPALGSISIQAKKSVNTGGLDWQKPVPPRDTGGKPGGGGAQSLLRPFRRVPPLRARSEGRRPRRPAHLGHFHKSRPALPPPRARSEGRSPVRHIYKGHAHPPRPTLPRSPGIPARAGCASPFPLPRVSPRVLSTTATPCWA